MAMKLCPWCNGKHRTQGAANRCGRRKVPQKWEKRSN